jgi:hypothetical protein
MDEFGKNSLRNSCVLAGIGRFQRSHRRDNVPLGHPKIMALAGAYTISHIKVDMWRSDLATNKEVRSIE